jgi:hypothetical protein
MKMELLGVRQATLDQHGAVSEATAAEMARGALRRFGAHIALSTTGVAGPTGGTADKPVGLVYVGLATAFEQRCERHVWNERRLGNKWLSVEASLRLLIDHLEGTSEERVDRQLGASEPYAPEADGGRTPGEVVTVDAAITEDGAILVRSFVRQGRRVSVSSVGRQWHESAPDGLKRCVLVMGADNSTYELCLDGADALWHLRRAWPRPSAV